MKKTILISALAVLLTLAVVWAWPEPTICGVTFREYHELVQAGYLCIP